MGKSMGKSMGKKKQPKPDSYRDPKDARPPEPERRYPDQDAQSRPGRTAGLDEETGIPAER
jgi:hypothetical protein